MIAAVALACMAALAGFCIRSIRASADREVANLQLHLRIEQERTGDLLTRLAARSLEQYQAVANPAVAAPLPPMRYVYDETGLVQLSEPEQVTD